jgi:ABC-type bacteriocin/lantibiotic exporter with double-glycine peptidase domain
MTVATAPPAAAAAQPKKPKQSVWPMVWELVRPRRAMLFLGLGLMGINRVSGLVLPWSTKSLIDDVIGKRQSELLMPLVGGVIVATLIQGATSFTLTQLLSKEAQRLIAEMREKVQAHVLRLPVAYYDSNKTGALVSRIMSDVEGVRNLIGTGLVEFVGGFLTAILSLVVLLRINAVMTLITATVLIGFTLILNRAVTTMRPIFRDRGKIGAEVSGRLT